MAASPTGLLENARPPVLATLSQPTSPPGRPYWHSRLDGQGAGRTSGEIPRMDWWPRTHYGPVNSRSGTKTPPRDLLSPHRFQGYFVSIPGEPVAGRRAFAPTPEILDHGEERRVCHLAQRTRGDARIHLSHGRTFESGYGWRRGEHRREWSAGTWGNSRRGPETPDISKRETEEFANTDHSHSQLNRFSRSDFAWRVGRVTSSPSGRRRARPRRCRCPAWRGSGRPP